MQLINLENKKIFISGGTSGIGSQMVQDFLNLGSIVFTIGTNDKKLDEIKNKFKNVKTKKFDLSDSKNIPKLIEEANEILGGLDVVINNAGITKDNLAIRMDEDEWKKVIEINLNAVFLICKNSIKFMMRQNRGNIINITSIVAHTGNFGQSNYAAAKSGVIGMTKSFAKEYAKKNIRFNCISPGLIETRMTDEINDGFKKKLVENIPMNRLGSIKDISNCAIFLASDLSNYITGETIHVNGGMYMA